MKSYLITQLHFSNFIDDFYKYIVVQKPILLELLDQYINIHKLIPVNWHLHYNKSIGYKLANPGINYLNFVQTNEEKMYKFS